MQQNLSQPTFNAILFDLDGTLLDTAPDFTFCINQMLLEHRQAPVQEEHFKHQISTGAKAMVKHAFGLTDTHPELAEKLADFLARYAKHLGEKTHYFPGIEQLLTFLNHQNIPWGIVTNKHSRFTEPLIEQFPLLQTAKSIVSGDTLPTAKPDPAPVLFAVQALKANPETTIFIGDALTDIVAGRSAGLKSMVAKYGYIHPTDNISDWNADYIIDHADQLLSYFV